MSLKCYKEVYENEFLELGEVRFDLDTKFRNCFK